MDRILRVLAIGAVGCGLAATGALATTREIAELEPARLTFGRSVLNELTYDTYRDPFDELQARPYNLLFANIGRHAHLSPWDGQEGRYTRYVNALIGNNGVANIDNDADSLQGSVIWRQTPSWSWGVSAAVVAGTDGSDDTVAGSQFSDTDDLTGFDVRGAAAYRLSNRRALGGGVRMLQATREIVDRSLTPGVGGTLGTDEFDQSGVVVDFGMRTFVGERSSWEVRLAAGIGSASQQETSSSLDASGAIVGTIPIVDYDLADSSIGVYGGYNRLPADGLGETQVRVEIERTQRELDKVGEPITTTATLLAQDPVTTDRIGASVRRVFAAGQTQMYVGGDVSYAMTEGSTTTDIAGTETIDDTFVQAGITIGLRQPMFDDRLRFIVGGRADVVDVETATVFAGASDGESATRTVAQYAVGLEAVLANVNLDLAWLFGDEEPVVPPSLGLPQGSRRTVAVDRLVFSAAVSW